MTCESNFTKSSGPSITVNPAVALQVNSDLYKKVEDKLPAGWYVPHPRQFGPHVSLVTRAEAGQISGSVDVSYLFHL